MFVGIDESAVSKAALRTKGATGPSGLDSDNWRRILISKNYASHGKDLRTAIAKMTQTLCTQKVEINNEGRTNLEVYTTCRLIPLDKKSGYETNRCFGGITTYHWQSHNSYHISRNT